MGRLEPGRSFKVPFSETGDLAPRRRAFLEARQIHCHVLGNAGLPAKLRRIAAQVEIAGPMRDLLANRNVNAARL